MADPHEPARIVPQSPGDYLEVMSKAGSQSGMSWKVVESKWSGIRQGFKGFDAEAVANLTPPELDDLSQDKRVIRNRRKI